jgi:hypothetical protein
MLINNKLINNYIFFNIYLHELAQKKYLSLVNNTDYVKLYEEYAKINLRVGLYKDNYYIPERY